MAQDLRLNDIVERYNKATAESGPGKNQELEIQLLTKSEKKVSPEEFSYFYTYFKQYGDGGVSETNILDMASSDNVRLTLEGREDIGAFCKKKDAPNLTWKCMKKTFMGKSMVTDYEMVITHQTEEDLRADLTVTKSRLSKITEYRFKKRTSFVMFGFRFDLTVVQTLAAGEGKLSKIFAKAPTYEVECEYVHVPTGTDEINVSAIQNIIVILAQIRQNNEIPVLKTLRTSVILQLKQLFMLKLKEERFPGAKVTTVEKKNVDFIKQKKYGVTDKTNGSRSLLYIDKDGAIFLMDMKWNLTKISGSSKDRECKNTVLDGELVIDMDTDARQKTYQFYAFDILAQNKKPVDTQLLGERYVMMQNVVRKLRKMAEAEAEAEEASQNIFQEEKTFESQINDNVKFVLRLKSYNMKPNAAEEIWAQRENYPYVLDGLIFTPFDEPYHFQTATWLKQFKWKPAEENSIDFLLKKTSTQKSDSTSYALMVGVGSGGQSESVQFNNAEIVVPLDGVGEGDNLPISDNTIVECIYRAGVWVVLKTRADKTEPNFITVAESVWRTIQEPIKVSDFTKEAGGYYTSDISQEEKQKSQPLRKFGNAVKQMLIRNYASGKTLVDFSCGQGGDLHKWSMEKVSKVLGIDLSKQNLTQFIERFSSLSPPSPDADYFQQENRVELWAGDTGKPLEGQKVGVVYPPALVGDKEVGRDNHDKYDVGVSFFTIHYYFDQKSSLESFFRNARDFIKVGGHLIITCLDGETVKGALDAARKLSGSGTSTIRGTVDGTRIFEIQKKYEDADAAELGFGMKINMFMHTISTDFYPEYLVPESLLVEIAAQNGFQQAVEKKMFGDITEQQLQSFVSIMHEDLDRFKALQAYYVFTYAPTAALATALPRKRKEASESESESESTKAKRPKKSALAAVPRKRKEASESESGSTNAKRLKKSALAAV